MSAAFPVRTLALLLLLVAGSAHAFEYAGLSWTIDPASLRELFPDSRHEFWERGTGSVAVPEDENERFETLLTEGDGRYVVRLAPDDTRAEVTSVSLTLSSGEVLRLELGFEREGQGIRPESIERRFPNCRRVLDTLMSRYGEPVDFTTRLEDNLEHRLRTWSGPGGIMRLDCGRFVGRKQIFAMDLEFEGGTFEPPPPPPPPKKSAPAAKPASKPASKSERKK
jgi:hypothetical protein